MFDFMDDEILNAFAIRWKISDLQKRLVSKRTPKKYHQPLRNEISRLEKLYEERRAEERAAGKV